MSAGKVIIGVIAIFLLLGVLITPIQNGIKSWRTDDATQSFSVTTGGGVTTANVTLAYELYQDAVPEVKTITSSIGATDAPAATSFDSVTNNLLVSGLAASNTRTLTINYYAETTDSIMKTLGPFLAVLIIGGLIALILYGTMHKGGH